MKLLKLMCNNCGILNASPDNLTGDLEHVRLHKINRGDDDIGTDNGADRASFYCISDAALGDNKQNWEMSTTVTTWSDAIIDLCTQIIDDRIPRLVQF